MNCQKAVVKLGSFVQASGLNHLLFIQLEENETDHAGAPCHSPCSLTEHGEGEQVSRRMFHCETVGRVERSKSGCMTLHLGAGDRGVERAF